MLGRLFPASGWLRRYRRADLRPDLIAGATVAVMLVPQGMAYAMLAGLPPVVGLYASTVPLVAYALLGSSRQLAVGPVAMVSLLAMAGCSELAQPGSEEYVALALLLALMVGVVQLALGLLRMGFIVNFMSHAVVSGFTSAAAIVICLSQLKHLLGVKLEGGEKATQAILEALARLGETHPLTLVLGLAGIAILATLRKLAPRVPGPLVVVAGGTLAVYALGLGDAGVRTVGEVPSGLPHLSLPALDGGALVKLAPTTLVIVFVGFMESIAVAQLIADREKQKVDPNSELRGLGLANTVAGLFSGYPVTGGFSRTAVNYQAGARTGLAGIVTAVLLALTLLFLTPLFYYLPNAVLAAIIVVAVVGLIDVAGARRLFRVKAIDGWTLVLTFAATLGLGVETGILLGIAFSLLVFIWRSAHPHTAELGWVEAEGVFRGLDRYPDAERCPGALVLRVDASLYFANMGFIEDCLRDRLADRAGVRWVVLDLTAVNDVDAVALDRLAEIVAGYAEHEIRVALAGMKSPVRDAFGRAESAGVIPPLPRHASVEHALRAVREQAPPSDEGAAEAAPSGPDA